MRASLPRALQPLASAPRWVGWKLIPQPGGKSKKLPIEPCTGKAAKSDDSGTWGTFAEAEGIVRARKLTGLGVMLGDLGDGRRLMGIDLDLCRSPTTGEIQPWAREKIRRLSTYTEVSPSGTGVKLYGFTARPVAITVSEVTVDAPIPEGAEDSDHDAPEIGLYPSGPNGRYFAVTGHHLAGTPDYLADITDAVAELAAELAAVGAKPKPNGHARPETDPSGSAAAEGDGELVLAVLSSDGVLADAWRSGAKLTGGGDDTASGRDFSLAVYLGQHGHSDHVIRAMLRAYGFGQIGTGKLTGKAAARRLEVLLATAAGHRERNEGQGSARPWPEPDLTLLETRRTPPPAFPLDVLGPWAEWVRAHAEVASAPIDYVAGALLCSAGAMVANTLWTSPWPGWREPPVLFVGCVGLPSSSKSPAIDTIFGPVRAAEKELGKDFPERHREWELAKAVAELKLKEWKAEVKAALEAGEPPPEKPDDAEVPPEPKRPRLFTTDATMEAAALLAQQEPKGLLLIRDELAGWVGGLDKYGGDGAERAFWIEAYGGRAKVVDRVKFDGKELFVPHLSIAILGGIQPDRLASMIIGGDDDGLAARFMLLWPEPVPLRRPRSMPDPGRLADALFRLRKLQPADWDQEQEPISIRFTDAAAEALHAFRLEVREIEAGASGQFLSHVGKWPGLAARLALILELLWWAGQDAPPAGGPSQVGDQAAVAAIGLVAEYVGPMARRVYGEAALPQAEQDAAALARRLVRLDPMPETINARELRRQRFLPTGEPDRYAAALAELEEAGWCRPAEATRPGPGRRPKDWTLNPALRGLA